MSGCTTKTRVDKSYPPIKGNTLSLAVPATHVVIPDTQVKDGVLTDHLRWAGRYIGESLGDRKNVTIIRLGDDHDMESLSSYDVGKRVSEGRRYQTDIDAGNAGLALFDSSLKEAAPRRWKPRKVKLHGNHEDRITRAANDQAFLDGTVTLDDLDDARLGWEVHPFLEVVDIDGVLYSHYFYNPMTGRPYGGQSVDTRLKTIGHSFTMGHQQGLWYGLRDTIRGRHHGLICGSFYLHDEQYKGPQGNDHWRGIVVCNQVEDGMYDPLFVSLDYLCRRYERMRLAEWLQEREGVAA
jgi:hypothetical protein